jgi:Uma2 family endonuclease
VTAKPDTVRAADVAFIRKPSVDEIEDTTGYWPAAPNLAVEVLDFDDTVFEVEEKVAEWLDVGSEQVWVLSPKLQTVVIYRSRIEVSVLTKKDSLVGGMLVPGFQIPVAEIFAE